MRNKYTPPVHDWSYSIIHYTENDIDGRALKELTGTFEDFKDRIVPKGWGMSKTEEALMGGIRSHLGTRRELSDFSFISATRIKFYPYSSASNIRVDTAFYHTV